MSLFTVVTAGALQRAVDSALSGATQEFVEYAIVFVIAGGVLKTAADYLLRCQTGYYAAHAIERFRNAVTARLCGLEYSWFQRHHSTDLLAGLNNEQSTLWNYLRDDLVCTIRLPLEFVLVSAYLVSISWKMYLSCVVAVPLFTWLAGLIGKHISQVRDKRFTLRQNATAVFQDTVSGMREVRAANAENLVTERFDNKIIELQAVQLRERYLELAFSQLTLIGQVTPSLLIPAMGAWFMSKGAISVGDMIVYWYMAGYIIQAADRLNRVAMSWKRAHSAITRSFEVFVEPAELSADSEKVALTDESDKTLEFANVSFTYVEGKPTVEAVSFSVQRGQLVALVGASGGGKSTILRLALGLFTAQSGAIRLFGRDIKDWNIENYRDNIAYLSQEPFLFPVTLEKNIVLERENATTGELAAAIAAARVDEFTARLPDGLQTIAGERGTALSGGQKQRVALARALLKKAPLVIVDEPAASLDALSETAVTEALDKAKEHSAVLVVAHRLHTVQHADLILVLSGGVVVESGTHAQLMVGQGVYKELYEKMYY